MLLRMRVIEQVGGMDERYFLYMEDVDWCRSFGLAGWTVQYDPRAVVVHAGKHASLEAGIMANNTRWHLQSLGKYFLKNLFA